MSTQALYWAHPTAVIDQPATIGAGTKIWHFTHVMAGARIGSRCVLGQNVFVGARTVVGDRTRVQNNVSIYDTVELEHDVFVGPSVVFTNVVNPRAFIERKSEYLPTRVAVGASIGANATIVCGVDLGAYCFIAAGAVVTKSVPAHALMMGVPARFVAWVCCCAERLEERDGAGWACPTCRRSYRLADDGSGLEPTAAADEPPPERGER